MAAAVATQAATRTTQRSAVATSPGICVPRSSQNGGSAIGTTTPDAGGRAKVGVLRGAAEAVAASLVDGAPLEPSRGALRDFRDALLAEHADADDAAAARCTKLRCGFSAALLAALSSRPKAGPLLLGEILPHVRVDVRGTAGRLMTSSAFSVGRASECDVQICGDFTVSRLQLLVVSLPRAIVVIDAWSSGGTRVVRRSSEVVGELPSSTPSRRLAFVLAPDEQATLLVGMKTTVTVGPMASTGTPAVIPSSPPVPSSEAPTLVVSTPPITSALELAAGPSPVPTACPADVRPSPSETIAGVAARLEAVAAAASAAAAAVRTPPTAAEKSSAAAPAAAAVGAAAVVNRPLTPASQNLCAPVPQVKVQGASRNNEVATPCTKGSSGKRKATDAGSGTSASKKFRSSSGVAPPSSKPTAPPSKSTASEAPADAQDFYSPGTASGMDVHSAAAVSAEAPAASKDAVKDEEEAPLHKPKHPALARGLAVVRATVRWRQIALTRRRLVARCKSAARLQLITPSQASELEERLQREANSLDEVRDILDGLGIPAATSPDVPGAARAAAKAAAAAAARLNAGMAVRIHGLEAQAELNGATGVLEEWLAERARWAVKVDGVEDTKAIKPRHLRPLDEAHQEEAATAVSALMQPPSLPLTAGGQTDDRGAASSGQDPTAPRRRSDSASGGPSRCTKCGGSPYHYHAECGKVEVLRTRWLEWLEGGREAYHRLCRQAHREAAAQRRALKEAAAAAACGLDVPVPAAPAFDDDEDEGLDGANLSGPTSVASSSAVTAAAAAVRGALNPKRRLLAARSNAISGQGVVHFFATCAFCGSEGEKCILGPRFRCVHCPAFDCCLQCEPRLAHGVEHDERHVFEILFESEFDWGQTSITLPSGTKARLRNGVGDAGLHAGGGAAASSSSAAAGAEAKARKRRNHGFEGIIRGFKKGKYDLEIPGVGTRRVGASDLQPLLSQRQAERLLGAESQAVD
eukprot:TRINITY_DN76042_c0_g1_i1.p1 TRINITY_DN76042_c0_g1~~TRINITY_DN76042_c0_g1_i1.p1  ORF type:complete len:989 (+),score=205.67 TRINITY_DN76042_c0_g1_i1:26-2968(+)